MGANQELKTISAAARVVQEGGVIEVEAGDYVADVAVWDKPGVCLRAVGGRARLIAASTAAEGKAIWVVRTENIQVEGFDFEGASVPSRNGAGIRLERGSLAVRNCRFIRNENGILTGNRPETRLQIEDCEFGHNGYGDGQSHNLYAGEIAHLSVSGSYFHHANVGHLLKTRAAFNDIRYNHLTDQSEGVASYELEFAAGGVAHVVGNVIQQSPGTNNPHLISFGAEGYKWPRNELCLVHNTLVDDRPQGGIFLRVKPGADLVRAENNVLVGNAKDDLDEWSGDGRNIRLAPGDFTQERDAYRLNARGRSLARAYPAPPAQAFDLTPRREFSAPRGTRPLTAKPACMGAMQNPG
ncbi:MAG: hypothetical protein JWQ88_2137 [Rhodoferax sp.]|nr:hypothetical protein [Rhodoferax sp.]